MHRYDYLPIFGGNVYWDLKIASDCNINSSSWVDMHSNCIYQQPQQGPFHLNDGNHYFVVEEIEVFLVKEKPRTFKFESPRNNTN